MTRSAWVVALQTPKRVLEFHRYLGGTITTFRLVTKVFWGITPVSVPPHNRPAGTPPTVGISPHRVV